MCSEQQVAKTVWCAGGWLMNMIVEQMHRTNIDVTGNTSKQVLWEGTERLNRTGKYGVYAQ